MVDSTIPDTMSVLPHSTEDDLPHKDGTDLVTPVELNSERVLIAKQKLKLGRSSDCASKSQYHQTVVKESLPAYPSDDVPTLRKQLAASRKAVEHLGAQLAEKDSVLNEERAIAESLRMHFKTLDPITKVSSHDPFISSGGAKHLERELTIERETSTKLRESINELTAKSLQDEEANRNQKKSINELRPRWVEAANLMKAVGVQNIAELTALIKAKDQRLSTARFVASLQEASIKARKAELLESGREKMKLAEQTERQVEEYGRELQELKRQLSFATTANKELEDAAKQLGEAKAE